MVSIGEMYLIVTRFDKRAAMGLIRMESRPKLNETHSCKFGSQASGNLSNSQSIKAWLEVRIWIRGKHPVCAEFHFNTWLFLAFLSGVFSFVRIMGSLSTKAVFDFGNDPVSSISDTTMEGFHTIGSMLKIKCTGASLAATFKKNIPLMAVIESKF